MAHDTDLPKRDLPERTFEFAHRTIRLLQEHDPGTTISHSLTAPLLHAVTALGLHCEEAHAGQNRADFHPKITHACRAAREAQYWLRLLAATDIIPSHHLHDLTDESTQLVAILTTIVRNAKRTD